MAIPSPWHRQLTFLHACFSLKNNASTQDQLFSIQQRAPEKNMAPSTFDLVKQMQLV